MRNVSAAMLAHLRTPAPTLAVLVLIQRLDGVTLGFTSWDTEIVYSGVTYLPAVAMDPSSVQINSDLTTDQMDIIGAIDSVYITEADLDGGRYDMANITVMRVNPFDLTMGQITDLTGTTGQIDYGDGNFTAAINSLGQQLNQQIGDVITPVCRVKQLGDTQCKINITLFQFAATVASVDTTNSILTFNDTHPTGYYDYGMVRFENVAGGGGLNYSINMEVRTSISNGQIVMTLNGSPTGGTFTITVVIGNNVQQTTALPWNAIAAAVQTALQALSNVGAGNMTVSGSAGGPYTITPTGSLASTPTVVLADGSELTGGTTTGIYDDISITTTGGTIITLQLQEPMPFPVSIGDAVILEAGCDRRGVTCRKTFNNLVNFHGELYVPGNNWLLLQGRPPS